MFSFLFGFRSIPTNSIGVKLRFGALSGIEDPGLTYVIPYVDELIVVPTQRPQTLIRIFPRPGATNPLSIRPGS
jgi:regulator of protease activity HflC (stomatin/prohibitin superfamily)